MKFLILVFLLLALPAFGATPFAMAEKLALRGAKADRAVVPRYGTISWTLDLHATYDNPFDPAQIDAWAVLTPPKGAPVRVNAFLDQPYARRLVGGKEFIEAAGPPVWRLMFTPDRAGTWRVAFHAKDRTGSVALPEQSLKVTPAKSHGFIRRSAKNPAAFAWEDGAPFFAVGEDMGWPGERGTYDYDDWLTPLGKAGGNWVRVWMCSWNGALEWTGEANGYHGAGIYNLANAWKIDRILAAAAENGIDVMLCFGTYGELTSGGFFNEGQWKDNPYNVANGGPCADPKEFWTDARARALYQQRLRYLAARYGCRTNLHSWEFWNEAMSSAAWTAEMAKALRGMDPYHHLITTTYGAPEIWAIPEIDFTQTHSYGTGDIPDHGPVVRADTLNSARYKKPHLMGEFGIDWRASDAKYDPDGRGVNLHNALWAAMASGAAGGAMIWWWDNYIHPKNLYPAFRSLAAYAKTVPWTSGPWEPLAVDPAEIPGAAGGGGDLVLPARGTWGKNPTEEFTVAPNGVGDAAVIPLYLFGTEKPDLRTVSRFHVKYRQPGRFILHLGELSNKAHLRVLLDGALALDKNLSAAPPADPAAPKDYETTAFKPEYGIYQAVLNKDYAVEVPEGAHTLTVEVDEGDWVTVKDITLTGYQDSRLPPLNLYGVRNGREAVLWIQNAEHTWKNVSEKKPIPPIAGARTTVRGLPPGRYRLDWWDTWAGKVTKTETVVADKSGLPLALPDVETDTAVRITAS